MLPAMVTIICGYLILANDLNYNKAASAFSGSVWLKDFAGANFPSNFHPSVWDALKQSLLVFIFPKSFYYNSNLWTMNTEFLGSMVIFFILLCYGVPGPIRTKTMLSVFATLFFIFSILRHALGYEAFLVGAFLSYIVATHSFEINFNRKTTLMITLLCVILLSMGEKFLGSVLVLVVLIGSHDVQNKLSGKIGYILGQFSFPLYLVHTLVILTLSSRLYIFLENADVNRYFVMLTILVFTVVVSSCFALPLVILERRWVPFLNNIAKRFTQKLSVNY